MLISRQVHQLPFTDEESVGKGCLHRTLGIVGDLVQIPVIDPNDGYNGNVAVLAISMRVFGCGGDDRGQVGSIGAWLHGLNLL